MSESFVLFSPEAVLGLLGGATCESVVLGVGLTAGCCGGLVSVRVEVEVEGCGSE